LAKTRAELEKVRADAQNGSDEAAAKIVLEAEHLRDELRKAQGEAIAAGGEVQKLREEEQKLKGEVLSMKDELRTSKRNADNLISELQLKENGIFFI
jgi:hypothetical protein